MKNRLLSTLLVLCIVLSMLPGTAWAANGDTSGSCGENLTWRFENGTLTISGSGAMFDYTNTERVLAPWIESGLTPSMTNLVIESGVTSIGKCAFYECARLISVSIPSSVTIIGDSAFSGCWGLANVTIPDSVTSIGNGAFSGTGLTSVTIPDSITSIGNGVFSGTRLTSVTIPDSVTSIGSNAFTGCSRLASVTIPDGITSIGAYAFSECALTSISIPDSVISIGEGAFRDCSSLTSVSIPSGVSSIKLQMFYRCSSLTSVTIPVGVTSIGDDAFRLCNSLTDVYYGGSESQWGQIEIGMYNNRLRNANIHYANANQEYKIYRDDGHEVFDVSLEVCMKKTASTTYNPQLAHMLIALSNAAYNDEHIRKSYESLGFDYDTKSDRHKLSELTYSIGTKQLENGTTMALVAIKGTESVEEWKNNAKIQQDEYGYHTGFSDSAKDVYDSLTEKFKGENFSNVIFVITGHSRGAAVANLLEMRLWKEGIPNERVYGYNFACPDVAVDDGSNWNPSGANNHNNIFNIGHAADPVSLIPGVGFDAYVNLGNDILSSWGKFGQSRWYARNWSDPNEAALDMTFSIHAATQYLDFLRNEYPLDSAYFKTWIERELAVAAAQSVGRLYWWFINIFCPVDVVITDANGTPVASVIGGEVDYYDSAFGEVMIFTDGDEKTILVQGNEPLTVQLTGTDVGTMDYIVRMANLDTGETLSKTAFTNVELTDGKQMRSIVDDGEQTGNDTDAPKVSLYVLDGNGNPKEEILPDGDTTHQSLFTDVSDTDWYYSVFLNAASAGFIKGVGDNKFEPESELQRAQFTALLVRVLLGGEPDNIADMSKWYNPYYAYANANGLLEGIPTDVNVEEAIPRYEMAQMVYNAAKLRGLDVSASEDFYDSSAGSYSSSYNTAIRYAYAKGLITGKGGGDFAGADTLERAQAAAVAWRFYELEE